MPNEPGVDRLRSFSLSDFIRSLVDVDLSGFSDDVCFSGPMSGRIQDRSNVLQLVTFEILIRFAPNLAQINNISFLTSSRNLFEITLKNKVAPSSE